MHSVPSLEQLRSEANAAVIAETELNEVERPRSVEGFFAQANAEVAHGLHAELAEHERRYLSKDSAHKWARVMGVVPKEGGRAGLLGCDAG